MKKKIFSDKILTIVFSLIIVVICCFNLNRLYGPIIVPDETGYWATGYYLNGVDWSGIMGTSPYYGWGYGVVLSIVLKIVDTPIWAFRIAIILNGFLLVNSFILLVKISDLLFPDLSSRFKISVSFCTILYAGNIYYSQTTYCETLLLCVFLLVSYVLLLIILNPKSIYICYLTVALALLFAVHLRSVVIVGVVGGIILVLFVYKKIDLKNIILWIVLTGVLLLCVLVVKEYISEGLYKNSIVLEDNNISGQLSKAELLLSWEGIRQLIGSIIGKIMYAGTASFLLFYTSIYTMSKKIIRYWVRKEKVDIKERLFIIFILVAFGGELLISAYSLITYGRLDHIVYGRYTDFLMSLLLLYGICSLRENLSKDIILVSIAAHVSIVLLTYRFIVNKDYLGRPSFYTIPGIAGMWIRDEMKDIYKVSFYVGLISTVIFLIICIFVKWNKMYTMLSFVSLGWIIIAFNAADQSLYYEQEMYEKDFNEFANGVDDIIGNDEVYYVINDTEYVSWLKFKLKFFLPETNVIACESYEYENVPEGSYLIIYEKDNYYDEITDTFEEPIYISEYFSLRRKEIG